MVARRHPEWVANGRWISGYRYRQGWTTSRTSSAGVPTARRFPGRLRDLIAPMRIPITAVGISGSGRSFIMAAQRILVELGGDDVAAVLSDDIATVGHLP